ncbi:DUF2922 domain-containing protein [Peribacillus cavernae]|uniref:DUF2922 domain-containing protein n=1 Tax=Peribacillus cavernae TaxID=1674310 RepID=A0A433HPJ8_9BACI|nr:DUF2922 domain-containing protein [Peribacillus cavernae]MDQ0217328.1 hypothetical protein [Peribacillus cavernae]RUQ30213.1 DUF2922 domain-containing protein [Peribacillus cavernae]
MAKTLEMIFVTQEGKTASITIEEPKEPVDINAVKQAMDVILAANVFTSPSGDFVGKKGARVVERNVNEYEVI